MYDRRQFLLVGSAAAAFSALGLRQAHATGTVTWDTGFSSSPLSISGLTATLTSGSVDRVARCNTAISGKTVFEITHHFGLGNSNTDSFCVGVANSSLANNGAVGVSTDSAGFRPNSTCMSNGPQGYDSPRWDLTPLTNITLMIAVDPSAGKLWLYTGSAWIGDPTGSDDPTTGTGGLAFSIAGSLYPAISFWDAGDWATANFGATAFVYSTQWAALQSAGFTSLDAPAPTYAAGVTAASLQAVADLEFSPPGPTGATKTIAGNAMSIPTGVSLNDPSSNQMTIDPTIPGSVTLDGWDLSDGWDIIVKGTGTVTLSNLIWASKSGSSDYMLSVGMFQGSFTGGAPDVEVYDSTIVGTDQDINGVFAKVGSGSLNVHDCEIYDFGPAMFITAGDHNDGKSRSLTVADCWLHGLGVNARNGVAADPTKYWNDNNDYAWDQLGSTNTIYQGKGGAHCEFIKTNFGCTLSISGNLFDLFDNLADAGGGFTSLISVQGFEGVVSGSISGNVMRWNNGVTTWPTSNYVSRAPGYPLYFNSGPATINWNSFSFAVTVSGNAIQIGTSNHVAWDATAGASPSPSLTDGGGNYYYESAMPLSMPTANHTT